MERIDYLFSQITPTKVFADVGCDHGLVAKKVVESKIAEKVYITDISAPSLKKAENLLREYLGKTVFSVVCDGFDGINEKVDLALIAGMGGEEIIKIITSSTQKPDKLVLQPMKNADKLRKVLVGLGYKIIKDFTFQDGKFYDLIVCEKGEDKLSDEEILFGRTNLIEKPQAFKDKLKKEIDSIDGYLKRALSEETREQFQNRKKVLERLI